MLSLVGSRSSSILFRSPIGLSSKLLSTRSCSSSSAARCSTYQPPDVAQLAGTARVTLSPKEVEDFAPKIRQVIDWFGQLLTVDLQSVEPSLRAEIPNLRWGLRKMLLFSNTPSTVGLSCGSQRFHGPVHNLLVVETRSMGGSGTNLLWLPLHQKSQVMILNLVQTQEKIFQKNSQTGNEHDPLLDKIHLSSPSTADVFPRTLNIVMLISAVTGMQLLRRYQASLTLTSKFPES